MAKNPEVNSRDEWPPVLSPEQTIRAELEVLEATWEEAASSPEKALAFLQEVGLLDSSGNLAAPYHD